LRNDVFVNRLILELHDDYIIFLINSHDVRDVFTRGGLYLARKYDLHDEILAF